MFQVIIQTIFVIAFLPLLVKLIHTAFFKYSKEDLFIPKEINYTIAHGKIINGHTTHE